MSKKNIETVVANKKIGLAVLKIGQENGITGVPSSYETIGGANAVIEGVRVRVPSVEAKYMVFVPYHEIAVAGEKNEILKIEIAEHYVHGDFTRRLSDGKIKPSVIRHFFVPRKECGKDIIAKIQVQKKVNFISSEETLIINIYPSELTEANRELKLGTMSIPGKEKEEIPIPDSELIIAFRKIKSRVERPLIKTVVEAEHVGAPSSTAAKKTIEIVLSEKKSVKKIVLSDGQKKFVLQH